MRLIVSFLLALLMTTDVALSCDRCGFRGRFCRFQSHAVVQQVHAVPHVVQQVAYQQPAYTQNLTIVSSAPVQPLIQGNSVYGFNLAAAPYSFDSTAYMDRASRFQELALETAQQGINGFNANAAQATALADAVDRRTKNAMVALAAIQANQQQPVSVGASGVSEQSTVQSSVTRFTIRNGVLSVDNGPQSQPQQPGQIDPNVPPPAPNGQQQGFGVIGIQACARCHDGQGTHHEPKDVVLDGSRKIDRKMLERCNEQMLLGKMPQGADMTLKDRAATIADLATLLDPNEQPLNANRPPNF